MDIKKRINSFRYAFRGVAYMIKTQPHARFHVFAAAVVTAAGFIWNVSRTEWLVLILCFGAVLAAEALNTAVESLTDLVTGEYHPLAEKAKDTAAGAVLIIAAATAAVGILIFLPKIAGWE